MRFFLELFLRNRKTRHFDGQFVSAFGKNLFQEKKQEDSVRTSRFRTRCGSGQLAVDLMFLNLVGGGIGSGAGAEVVSWEQ